MRVFFNGRLLVVETNIAWALPYWKHRAALPDNKDKIKWEMVR